MHKKLFLALVAIIAIHAAKAQTEKGSQMLGASFGFSTSSSDTKAFNNSPNSYDLSVHGKIKSYNIAPSYSYFIADKLDLGVSVGYGRVKSESNGNYASLQKTHSFSSAVYLRKYFLYENKVGIRTGPYFSYINSNQTFLYSNTTPGAYNYAGDIYSGGIGLDFVYFPIKKLGLSAGMGSISYTHQVVDGTSKGTSNSFGLNFANSLSLSVNYVFGK
jgi:long-subunit fatty acid transport protein